MAHAHYDLKVILAPDGKVEVNATHEHIHGHDHARDHEGAHLSADTDAAMRAMLQILGVDLDERPDMPKPPQPNGVPEGHYHGHKH